MMNDRKGENFHDRIIANFSRNTFWFLKVIKYEHASRYAWWTLMINIHLDNMFHLINKIFFLSLLLTCAQYISSVRWESEMIYRNHLTWLALFRPANRRQHGYFQYNWDQSGFFRAHQYERHTYDPLRQKSHYKKKQTTFNSCLRLAHGSTREKYENRGLSLSSDQQSLPVDAPIIFESFSIIPILNHSTDIWSQSRLTWHD